VPPPNVFGGSTSQSFAYDDLYRLTHAEGTFQFSPSKSHSYAMDTVYDTIHNIALNNPCSGDRFEYSSKDSRVRAGVV